MNSVSISYSKGRTVKFSREKNKEYIRLDENLRVPTEGRFVALKHWDQFEGKGDNKNEFPEMFNASMGLELRESRDGVFNPEGDRYTYVELEAHWQKFLWDVFEWSAQSRLPKGEITGYYKKPFPNDKRTFAHTTPGSQTYVYVNMVEAHRAFTEAASPEAGARDVMTKRNMNNPRDYEWLCFPTGGNMLKVKKEVGTYYEIEAIDLLKPPPSIQFIADRPWLRFWCTQWGKYSGSTRFPQIKNANEVNGLPPAGIASPLFSKGGVFRVLKKSCIELKNGASWSPYAPK